MNLDLFREKKTWMIVVPAILSLWAMSSALKCYSVANDAKREGVSYDEVMKNARYIVKAQALSARPEYQNQLRIFDGIRSAQLCAQAAVIGEAKLSRGEGGNPVRQQDGSMLYRESYRLNGIRLVQLAKFIDFAESNFEGLICTQVSINQARGRETDLWDVTVSLKYVVQ